MVSLLCCWGVVVQAQNRMISGKVVTETDGKALPGAVISVKGHTAKTIAGDDGAFKLAVPAGNIVLIVNSVGYISKEAGLRTGQFVITIELAEQSNKLNEVVVTALGIQRQAKSLSYSAQRITSDKINEIRDANFVNTLSGKVAGLVVTQSASGPGGPARVVLRGNRSIQGSNNALFVIDGVAIDNSTIGGQVGNDFGGQNGNDGISNINPDDIESINVLKGAAASVLYGSRAANGVILITTKKGKIGKLGVDVNSGVTIESPFTLPKVQNTYGEGKGGVSTPRAGASWGAASTTYPNNIKDFFRKGLSTNNSVSINSGSEKGQTYFSYANNYSQGLVPTNDLNRHTVNLRITNQISKRLSTDAKLTYIVQNIFNKPRVGEESSVTMNLYKIPRSVDLNIYKDAYQVLDPNTNLYVPNYWTTSSIYTNPYWSVYNTHRDEDRSRIIGLISAKYEITPWLNIQGRVSLDKYNDKITQKFNANTLLFAGKGGSYSVQYFEVQERNMDLLLTGNNSITKDLKISYSIGSSVLERSNITNGVSANGLLVPNKFDLNFAQTSSFQTGAAQTQLQSVYGTTQLNYKDYLYLDVTGRNDWSSTLPNPYAYFYPSVGLTAVLSDMIKLPGYIDFAKIRLSSTQVGNDAPAFLLMQTYGFSPGGTGGFIARDGTRAIADLKPELTTSQEIGTEWRFLKGRLSLDVTLYKTNSKNQLLQLGLAPASGYSSQYINAGNIENKGIELQVSATPVSKAGFKWDIGLNYALNTNKVIELSPDITKAFLSGGYGRTAGPIVKVDGSYGDLYAIRWARNADGSFQTGTDGKPVPSATQEFIGNYNPKYTTGMTNTFTYNNFVVSVLVDGKVGGVMTSGTDANLAFDGTAPYTTQFRQAGSWTLPGSTKAVNAEAFWTTVSGGRYSWGEFFTYDATNFRVREVSIGYKFTKMPAAFIKGIKLSLIARNLLFLYRGKSILDIPGIGKRTMNFDPDINLGNGNYQGVEYGTMPSTRSIGLNLKLSF